MLDLCTLDPTDGTILPTGITVLADQDNPYYYKAARAHFPSLPAMRLHWWESGQEGVFADAFKATVLLVLIPAVRH